MSFYPLFVLLPNHHKPASPFYTKQMQRPKNISRFLFIKHLPLYACPPPCLRLHINCVVFFLSIQNRFSVSPPLLFKVLFLFAPLFKKRSFLSFFLSPLPLCLENIKSVQSLHALCFFILQPNASDKIYPHNAEHHKGIKAQYHQVVSDGLCRIYNLSRVYQRRYQ